MNERQIISVNGLCKNYRSGGELIPVLDHVDLEIERGECLFLAGPSGSGKTTLLSILGCVLSADSGSVRVLGEETTRFLPTEQARFRREHLGFVFQKFHLFDALTARENISIPLTLLKWPKREALEKAQELLGLVGLQEKANRRTNQLSMGQRQRIAVARALAGDPEIILADEPTASLDEESGIRAMEVLKNLCHSLGKTVVVVTHDSRIFRYADRILHLSHGHLSHEHLPDGATESQSSSRLQFAGMQHSDSRSSWNSGR